MPRASRTIDNSQLTIDGNVTCHMSLVTCRVKQGFTLIEFLVVLGVLLLAIGSALLLLTSIFRGTNQANITAEVRQNGQAVFDNIDSQIRNSRDVTDLSPLPPGSLDGISLTLADGSFMDIACFGATGSSNGWIGVATTLSPSYSDNPLTNKDLIAGVDVGACTFDVIPASAGTVNSAIVSFGFVASQAINAPSRQDFKANVEFKTTISLRRY